MRKRAASSLDQIPSATGGIARLACSRLRQAGKDPSSVLAAAGLAAQDVEDRRKRLKAGAQVEVLELAAQELQDDYLGFRLARDFDLGEIGLVFYVMASSERLADALENAERYCAINNEGVRLRISTDRGLTIGFEYLNVDRHSDRHHAEFWVVTMVRIARALTGSRLAPERITLRHLRRQIPQDVRSHLGCDVSDAAGRDEVCFPVSMSALPIVGADKHLNRLLLDYANEALGQRTSRHNSMRAQVEHHLIELLPHGRANVTEVARRLGISVRTLARAMSDEGAMFSMVLANLRQALARRYLLDEQLSITEIAWLLGYREVSSFTHAFAGWTGMTPREFRTSGPHT